MPFKSEKQRRYLWAKHPEIAKKWSKEYPTKKKLPLYSDENKKQAEWLLNYGSLKSPLFLQPFRLQMHNSRATAKFAESMRVPLKIKDPETADSEKKEQEKNPVENQPNADTMAANSDENRAKMMLSKMAAVLSPVLLRAIEERKAREEHRKARYIAQNVNIKSYPQLNLGAAIPPPMGMAPPPQAQPQQVAQVQQPGNATEPLGGGSNPMHNPINAFGALSVDGKINGNAAFGAKNSPESLKFASTSSALSSFSIRGHAMTMPRPFEQHPLLKEAIFRTLGRLGVQAAKSTGKAVKNRASAVGSAVKNRAAAAGSAIGSAVKNRASAVGSAVKRKIPAARTHLGAAAGGAALNQYMQPTHQPPAPLGDLQLEKEIMRAVERARNRYSRESVYSQLPDRPQSAATNGSRGWMEYFMGRDKPAHDLSVALQKVAQLKKK